MSKLLSLLVPRMQLLLGQWEPEVLYPRALACFVVMMGFLCGSLVLKYRGRKRVLDLMPLLLWFATTPAVFSFFVLVFGEVNFPLIVISGVLSCIFSTLIYLCERDSDALLPGKSESYFSIGMLFLGFLMIFSLGHNFVPPQYDVTTYQFMGDLLFRKGSYPIVDNGGSATVMVAPPGFFFFEVGYRYLWNDPRAMILISGLVFLCFGLALAQLAMAFFKTHWVRPFVFLAMFSRGVCWIFWEQNLLRMTAVVCGVLSLKYFLDYVGFGRERSVKFALIPAQLFLASALMSHPQQTAYILALSFVIACGALVLGKIPAFTGVRKFALLAGSFVFPLSLVTWWGFKAVLPSQVNTFSIADYEQPVPHLFHYLTHSNGFVPTLMLLAAVVLLLRQRETRGRGMVLGGLFLATLAMVYWPLGMHFILPSQFPLIKDTWDEFRSASSYVKTSIFEPSPIVLKVAGFWWMTTGALAFVYYFIWRAMAQNRALRNGVMGVLFGLSLFDTFFMYYNRPILKESQYGFLHRLGPKLRDDAVLIGPPGHFLSAWLGPLLHRDTFSYRGIDWHLTSVRTSKISALVTTAFNSGSFEEVNEAIDRDRAVFIFPEDRLGVAKNLVSQKKWRLLYAEENIQALMPPLFGSIGGPKKN